MLVNAAIVVAGTLLFGSGKFGLDKTRAGGRPTNGLTMGFMAGLAARRCHLPARTPRILTWDTSEIQ